MDNTAKTDKQSPFFFRFFIGYPATDAGKKDWNRRYSLNAYYSGKHHSERTKDAEYWHALTLEAMRRKTVIGKAEISPEPVAIQFLFNDNLDCSNHAAIAKMIEDAMKGVIIKDDNRKWVKLVSMGFHDKPYIQVTVKGTQGLLDRKEA